MSRNKLKNLIYNNNKVISTYLTNLSNLIMLSYIIASYFM